LMSFKAKIFFWIQIKECKKIHLLAHRGFMSNMIVVSLNFLYFFYIKSDRRKIGSGRAHRGSGHAYNHDSKLQL
jgi:hypothetical protein